jgi:mevalonate kinase
VKKTFYSNGKLLITGEYVVLDGATALALPTSYGQSLDVDKNSEPILHWTSFDEKGNIWFESKFDLKTLESKIESNKTSKTLSKILIEAKKLNPDFLSCSEGYKITTKLNFPRDWGLGSSSTLINNIAQWANVDAFKLLSTSFGGSGYDIAAAQNDQSIFYRKTNPPTVKKVHLPWEFRDQLWFIHLNQKQDSKEGIKRYRETSIDTKTIQKISDLSAKLLLCYSLDAFEKIIESHEAIISELIELPTIKTQLFQDYPHTVKSLGAWGGDFILVTGEETDLDYFRKKGFHTIVGYSKMIK